MSNLITDPPVGQDPEDVITQSLVDYSNSVNGTNYTMSDVQEIGKSQSKSKGFGDFITKLFNGDWSGAIGDAVDFIFGIGSSEVNYQRNKQDYEEQFAANNAEYDRRVAQQNSWNAGWADRLRSQGINPLSAVGQGVTGQSASMSSPNGYSGPLSALPNILENMLTGVQVENVKADTSLKTFDIQLKEQLYNYNSTAYPVLLQQSQANLSNTIQEYNNLVAKEEFDKKAAQELEQRILKEFAETEILKLQKILVDDEHKYNEARLKQMAQDFETGKFVQEYEKWHAQHEQALAFLAETQGKITNEQFEQLYANGLFGELKQQELQNLKQTYNKLVAQTGRENAEWQKLVTLGLGDNSTGFSGHANRTLGLLLYLCTELI